MGQVQLINSSYGKLGTMTSAIARDLMPIGAAMLLFDNE